MKMHLWKLGLILGGIVAFGIPAMLFLNNGILTSMINVFQRYSLPLNNAACMEELKTLDVDYKPQGDFTEPKGCSVKYSVRLSRVGKLTLDNSPLLTCRMAVKLAKFEVDLLQPTARDILGQAVKRLRHKGTYNCRSMRKFKGVLSQHAFANAIDVSGFELSDGSIVSVEKDWSGQGDKSKFLNAVSQEACDIFRTAISPNSGGNHSNHFH